jgi:hypothetical protein
MGIARRITARLMFIDVRSGCSPVRDKRIICKRDLPFAGNLKMDIKELSKVKKEKMLPWKSLTFKEGSLKPVHMRMIEYAK